MYATWRGAEILRLTDAGRSLIGPCDVVCGIRWEVSGCGTVLVVAVKTAVTRWQPGGLRHDQRRRSPLGPPKGQALFLFRSALGPVSASAAGAGLLSTLSLPSTTSPGARQNDHYSAFLDTRRSQDPQQCQ